MYVVEGFGLGVDELGDFVLFLFELGRQLLELLALGLEDVLHLGDRGLQ